MTNCLEASLQFINKDGVLSDWAQQNGIYAGKLSEIRDIDVFLPIAKKISQLAVFQKRNHTGNGMYGASLRRYEDYLVWVQKGADLSGESSLDPELEVARKVWIERIQELEARHLITNVQLNQKSPKFQYGNWYIGAEHQRKFKSVALKWLGPSETLAVDKIIGNRSLVIKVPVTGVRIANSHRQ